MKRFIILLPVLRRMLLAYIIECAFILRAKWPYLEEDISRRVNRGLSLRKRAHLLERCVLHPDAYPAAMAQSAAIDVEKLLMLADLSISPSLESWSRKILAEYREGTGCKCEKAGLKRESPAVSSDDLMNLLKQRRSRRFFLDTPLSREQKQKICEAAQSAPSSCNRQTLDLIFVEEPALKRFVAATIPGGSTIFHKAPCILVIVSDIGDYRYPEDRMAPFMDAAAAAQNICLYAETSGLGCCIGSYTSFGNIERESEVRRRLAIPDTHLIVTSLAIGPSDQRVCDIPRDPASMRLSIDSFGNKINE
jgi:nitroreductase